MTQGGAVGHVQVWDLGVLDEEGSGEEAHLNFLV